MERNKSYWILLVTMCAIFLVSNLLVRKYLGVSDTGYILITLIMAIGFGRIGRSFYMAMNNPSKT